MCVKHKILIYYNLEFSEGTISVQIKIWINQNYLIGIIKIEIGIETKRIVCHVPFKSYKRV